ncbi:hypothetical protein CI102_5251 [Trichoderma harzianum]|nr:hypothetical protein CI102_5251 [Trichoderma harzianum]
MLDRQYCFSLFSFLLLLHHDSLEIFPFQLPHAIIGNLISYCAKLIPTIIFNLTSSSFHRQLLLSPTTRIESEWISPSRNEFILPPSSSIAAKPLRPPHSQRYPAYTTLTLY